METPNRVPLNSPEQILAAVPYMLTFHPSNCLVVIGFLNSSAVIAAHVDLDVDMISDDISTLSKAVDRSRFDEAVVIGYGPLETVAPQQGLLHGHLKRLAITVLSSFTVHNGRYWLWTDPDSPGREYRLNDPTASPIAAELTFAGLSVLPNREAVTELLAPVTGATREAMRRATEVVERDLLARRMLSSETATAKALDWGYDTLRQSLDAPELPDIDATANLAAALRIHVVRDRAIAHIDATVETADSTRLWIHLVRHAERCYLAAPALLTAYSAWRTGHGLLAQDAIAIAVADDPDDPTVQALERILDDGIPPADVPTFPSLRPNETA